MNTIELTLSENSNEVFMSVTLKKDRPLPTINELTRKFNNSNYRNFCLDENELSLLSKEFSASPSNENENSLNFKRAIASAIDASLELTIAQDKMTGTITLTIAQGGTHIGHEQVITLLSDNSITKGVNLKEIDLLIEQGESGTSGEKVTIDVAFGQAAINGIDGYIKYLVPDPIERVLRPKTLENGNVDMRELGDIFYLQKGTRLAKLIKPTKGKKGYTILGAELEPKAGQECAFELGEGTSFKDDQKTIIIASIDGMPKHQPSGVSVSQVFSIENVDISTGNIEFKGSIIVQGNICEAMKVKATGDVIVGGLVESASVYAGGDICISQGVIGHQVEDEFDGFDNSTSLIANGNIDANFVQYANLKAKGNITIVQYLSHSQVTLSGHLWVGTTEKPSGKVFSCYIQTGKSIQVGTLGSPSGATTSIDYNHLLDALMELKKRIKNKSQSTLTKTKQIIHLIEQIDNKEIKREDLLTKLNNALTKYLPALVKLNKAYYDKTDLLELHLKDVDIIVNESVLSGVDIAIAARTYSFKRDHGPSRINFIEDNIKIEPIV